MIFLFKQMPRVPHKKIKLIIQSARHAFRKGESACYVSENAQSAGLGDEIWQKKFIGKKTKSDIYYSG